MPPEVRFKTWVYVGGRAVGELDLPPECMGGRASAEGLEAYIVVGAVGHPMASGSVLLAFDHGFPPRDSET